MKKTILITGASTGIGKQTAIYFATKGWNVAATMRNTDKGLELKKFSSIELLSLDVLDKKSIQQAIDTTIQTFGAIDVVFNNAGYALVGAFEAMSEEQIRKQFDTNLFGLMNVSRSILPYFRERKQGTIINTSSMGGLLSFPLYSSYHGTKFAIEGFMESLQYELKPFNIKVKNIEPGAIKTNFEDSIQFATNDTYNNYALKAHQNMLDTYKHAPNGEIVAKRVFEAANDNSFRLRYPVGLQSSALLFLRRVLPNKLFFQLVRLVVENGI